MNTQHQSEQVLVQVQVFKPELGRFAANLSLNTLVDNFHYWLRTSCYVIYNCIVINTFVCCVFVSATTTVGSRWEFAHNSDNKQQQRLDARFEHTDICTAQKKNGLCYMELHITYTIFLLSWKAGPSWQQMH